MASTCGESPVPSECRRGDGFQTLRILPTTKSLAIIVVGDCSKTTRGLLILPVCLAVEKSGEYPFIILASDTSLQGPVLNREQADPRVLVQFPGHNRSDTIASWATL